MISFLKRLVSGDQPLQIVFWVYGMFGGGVLFWILLDIQNKYNDIVVDAGRARLFAAIVVLVISYIVIISICIWRSANKYKGLDAYGRLAKGALCFAIAGMISVFSINVPGLIFPESSELPVMLDEYTRLDSVEVRENKIHYGLTLISWRREMMNVNDFTASMLSHATTHHCRDIGSARQLKNGLTILLHYTDMVGQHVSDVKVDLSSCELLKTMDKIINEQEKKEIPVRGERRSLPMVS